MRMNEEKCSCTSRDGGGRSVASWRGEGVGVPGPRRFIDGIDGSAALQCLTLSSEYSCSTLRRPWSLSQPPSFIAGDDEALTDRSSIAADGSGYESGPETSQITPPGPRRSQPKLPRRMRPKTTWHGPSTGHWTWTAAALRASPARAAGHARV